jgi:hypothetical protein
MSFTFISLFQLPVALLRARYLGISINMPILVARTLRYSGRSFLVGAATGAVATWGRMRGRSEVEWQDRSWRILENGGEVKTDWVTIGGAGAGAVAGLIAAKRGMISTSLGTAVLGGAGAGSSIGVPFMIGTFTTGRKPT